MYSCPIIEYWCICAFKYPCTPCRGVTTQGIASVGLMVKLTWEPFPQLFSTFSSFGLRWKRRILMKRAGLAWFKGVYNCEHTMLKNTFEIHTKINTQKTFMNLVPFQQSFGVYNCQTYETSNCFYDVIWYIIYCI